jgi:hypothetical protein
VSDRGNHPGAHCVSADSEVLPVEATKRAAVEQL